MTNLLLPLNLQFFAEDNGAEPQQDAPKVDEPPKDGAEPQQDAPQPEEKLLTQAELNEIVAKRIERERKKYADYDELKAQAAEYAQKLEEQRLAELSEKERAEELAQKYEAEKQELAQQLEAERKARADEKIKAAFVSAATKNGIKYVDDALALSDLSEVTIDENGAVIGIDAVIANVIEHKPYLLAPKLPDLGGNGDGHTETTPKSAEQLLAEAAEKAKTGNTEDRMAYAKLKRKLGIK